MKTFAARLSVLALALTGFTASTIVSKAAPHKSVTPAVVAMGTTPMTMCAPSDPSHCGLD